MSSHSGIFPKVFDHLKTDIGISKNFWISSEWGNNAHILSLKHHTKELSDFLPFSDFRSGLGGLFVMHILNTRCLDEFQGHVVRLFTMCYTGGESKWSNDLMPRKSLTLHNTLDLFLCHAFVCAQKRLACGLFYWWYALCPRIIVNVL